VHELLLTLRISIEGMVLAPHAAAVNQALTSPTKLWDSNLLFFIVFLPVLLKNQPPA
jgi:hypothetical protein